MAKAIKSIKRCWPFYLMLLPGTIYLIINNYIPMTGIVVAFKQYNVRDGLYNSPNIGLKNFEFLFKTNDAWIMIRNTLLYNLAFIIIGTVLAITVAIVLNEIKNKASKQAYQTVILIPFLISMVVVSYLGFAFLSDGNGFLNKTLLPALGIEPISLVQQPPVLAPLFLSSSTCGRAWDTTASSTMPPSAELITPCMRRLL